MRAWHATIIRDGILTAHFIIDGGSDTSGAIYPRLADNRLWFRAYWRTLHNSRVRRQTRNMLRNARPESDMPQTCALLRAAGLNPDRIPDRPDALTPEGYLAAEDDGTPLGTTPYTRTPWPQGIDVTNILGHWRLRL